MLRGFSLRKLALLIFGPMLVETLAMLFNSWMPLQAATRMGRPPRDVMLIGVAGAAAYALSSFIAGRWVTPRVAPWLMIGNIVAVTVCGCLAMWVDEFWVFPVATGALGLLIGHYYTPFQINMGHVRPFQTLAWSVAFYNVAWGSGSAIGTMLGGSLGAQPAVVLAVIAVAVLAVHTVINVVALYAPAPAFEEAAAIAFASTPRMRRVAFICFVGAGFVFRALLLTLWPSLQPERGWSGYQTGVGYFLLSAPIPLGALLWAKLRFRLREPWIMLAAMIVGGVGFLIIPFTGNWWVCMGALLLVGTMESCVVFHALYYANADMTTRGRSIGTTEMLAGGGAILGPTLLGLLAWERADTPLPYVAGVAVLVFAIGYTVRDRVVHGRM